MKKLSAYNNRQSNKNIVLARHARHVELDTLMRGQGYMTRTNAHWKGCNITCLLNAPTVKPDNVTVNHNKFNNIPFCYPTWLGYLLDRIHENCSSMKFSQTFTHDLIEAVPVGFSDWRPIMLKFLLFILKDMRKHNPNAIDPVIKLFKRELKDDIPTMQEWENARTAAAAYAAYTAYTAAAYAAYTAYTAAAYAAYTAAAAAATSASAAAYAAAAAATSDAAVAADATTLDKYARYLVKLFKNDR